MVITDRTDECHKRYLKVFMDRVQTEDFLYHTTKSAFYVSTFTFLGFITVNGKIGSGPHQSDHNATDPTAAKGERRQAEGQLGGVTVEVFCS